MAGHSKWAQIKRQKAVTDSRRGALFTKLSKNITVAVKTGGGSDPNYNFKLKAAIDKAKEARMPKDNIDRAIDKGTGKSGEYDIREVIFEGYLPGGVAVMVFGATENNNRTSSEIKLIFSKAGGSIGASGSVAFMFEKKGVVRITRPNEDVEEKIFEIATEIGFDDIDFAQDEEIILYCSANDIEQCSKEFESKLSNLKLNLEIKSSQEEYLPSNTVLISDPDTAKSIIKAIDAFEDHDDVIEVVSNFDLSQDITLT